MSDEIIIRRFASHADYQACVDLQYETWGRDFKDAVPASILLVNQKIGGVSAGAFDAHGTLVGFVFGMTGVEDGRVVHWSDMLAVRAGARDKGIGRRLKAFQRGEVAKAGGTIIYWTYDPLVARNAHLNFNVCHVRAVQYVRDMYGENTGSDLHRGIGTDRLVVAWDIDDTETTPRTGDIAAASARPEVTIEVPMDIASMQTSDVARAAEWRATTRAAFEDRFAAGYRIAGFTVDAARQRAFYLLSKG